MPKPMDEVLSKGMGAAKSVKAKVSGLSGVFQTLAKQHGEASALLSRVKGNPDRRAELWPTIKKELLSHERGELRVVYPILRNHPETVEMADHHDREAGELEGLIAMLDETDIRSDKWENVLSQLIDTIQHHVDEEENQIFPKAMEVLGSDEAKRLDQMYLATQENVKRAA